MTQSGSLSKPHTQGVPGVTLWLIFSIYCASVGWLLSALHQLNSTGYAIGLTLGAVLFAGFRKRLVGTPASLSRALARMSRFRRLIPMTFLILGVLAFLGGVLYPPTNYDALAYRLPRILHWLADERWHWIHTEFNRVNTRACGIEWISALLLCLLQTDRLLFLINIVSFFLLPGLLFSLCWRLGISRRVAWMWMWLLPAGYCFLLQAGSVGNDLFPVVFVLAALDFALRARATGRISQLWLSILSAAFFTGTKANTMPLLLVWIVLVVPAWRLVFKSITGTFALAAVCLIVSFVPTALLNRHYCGDWTGAKAEHMEFKGAQPWARALGNSIILIIDSFMPPIAPFAGAWNNRVAPHLLPATIQETVNRNFQTGAAVFALGELPTEEGAGLGAGTTLLLLLTTLVAVCRRDNKVEQAAAKPGLKRMRVLFASTVLIATTFFLFTSFGRSTPRLMAPYFPLLAIPFLFPGGHRALIRKSWISYAVVVVSVFAATLLILNPARPLFPTTKVLTLLRRFRLPPSLLQRADRVYSVYRHRHDAFSALLAQTPPGTRVLGMVTYDDPETAMWLPYGSRRIVHVCLQDDARFLLNEGVRHIWVSRTAFQMLSDKSFDRWLEQIHGRELLDVGLDLRAASGVTHWALVEVPP